jgi:hypothetical protein
MNNIDEMEADANLLRIRTLTCIATDLQAGNEQTAGVPDRRLDK